MKAKEYEHYLPALWMREKLRIYKTLRRLRDDQAFRHKWVKQKIRVMKDKDPDLDVDKQFDLMHAYLEEFDFKFIESSGNPPSVHIEPKKFRGKYFNKILGIESANLSTCLNKVARNAAKDIVNGYGKTAILGNVFGKEYRNKLNRWVKKKIKEEFG